MASQIVNELRTTTDAVWARLSAQLHGMESYMERSDAPGEWTTGRSSVTSSSSQAGGRGPCCFPSPLRISR